MQQQQNSLVIYGAAGDYHPYRYHVRIARNSRYHHCKRGVE